MASTELTEMSKDLSTQNGTVTPAPVATPTPAPEGISGNANVVNEMAGPSEALKAASIAMSPKTTPTTPVKRTIQTYTTKGGEQVTRYSDGTESRQPGSKSAASIQADLMKASQGEINQINQYAAQQIEALKPRQDERLRENAGVNTLTGLAGSTEANRTTEKTTTVNQKENDLVRAEAATKISNILTGVKTKALEMAQTEREQFRLDTESAAKARTARIEEAVMNAATLAASGVTYEGLQTTDPEAYQALAEAVGGEELLKAQFTLNRPQEDILDKKIEGGKYVIAYRNPLTGATRIESVDLGLPANYTKTIDAGNRILAIPDNWDGDPSKLLTINKGLTPGQVAAGLGGSSSSGAYSSDLDALIGTTESIIPSKFGQETFRKNIARARSEADKISLIASVVLGKADAATKTDFTNQAVGIKQIDKAIAMLDEGAKTGVLESGAQYAFNIVGKDFDPKLAQINQYLISAIQPYRNSVTGAAWGSQEDGEYQQLFGSTKYSPAELRQRLVGVKEVLASKSSTALGSYVNPMGFYGDPFNTSNYTTSEKSGQLQGPDGQLYDASELNEDEYKEAISSGYTPV